jgi:hypothetical protein
VHCERTSCCNTNLSAAAMPTLSVTNMIACLGTKTISRFYVLMGEFFLFLLEILLVPTVCSGHVTYVGDILS